MRELWVWRAVAAFALVGWGATSWMLWPADAPEPSERVADAPEKAESREGRRTVFRSDEGGLPARRMRKRGEAPMARAQAREGEEVTEEVLELAREQVREEWRARREAGAEERLDRSLAEIETFVQEHQLDDDTHVALEGAITDMHARMRELMASRGEGDGDEAARDARREKFHESAEKMEADAAAVLPEELVGPFLERVRGGPPRGGPWRR